MAKLRPKSMPDRARQKTDEQLKVMEAKIGRVYSTHPALIAVKKEYDSYMKSVKKETDKEYKSYLEESDPERKAELKKIYTEKVESLTRKSKTYQKIIKKFVSVMAQANQDALNVVNSEMRKVYVENYNEVATDCRKVGIKVNG